MIYLVNKTPDPQNNKRRVVQRVEETHPHLTVPATGQSQFSIPNANGLHPVRIKENYTSQSTVFNPTNFPRYFDEQDQSGNMNIFYLEDLIQEKYQSYSTHGPFNPQHVDYIWDMKGSPGLNATGSGTHTAVRDLTGVLRSQPSGTDPLLETDVITLSGGTPSPEIYVDWDVYRISRNENSNRVVTKNIQWGVPTELDVRITLDANGQGFGDSVLVGPLQEVTGLSNITDKVQIRFKNTTSHDYFLLDFAILYK